MGSPTTTAPSTSPSKAPTGSPTTPAPSTSPTTTAPSTSPTTTAPSTSPTSAPTRAPNVDDDVPFTETDTFKAVVGAGAAVLVASLSAVAAVMYCRSPTVPAGGTYANNPLIVRP